MHKGNTKKAAFTLIELLVVIAIIALLLAIILPSLAIAKERARRVVCSKNVNQFIIAAMVYANDCDGDLPSGQSENGSDEHTPVITRKVGDALIDILGGHETMECPWLSDPFDGAQPWYYGGYGYVLGYHYLGGHGDTPWPVTEAGWKEWKSPQKSSDAGSMLLITELNASSSDRRTFAPHGFRGPINKYHKKGSGGMTPQDAGADGGNIGSLDGSVSWKKIEDMKFRKASRVSGCIGVW